VYGNDVMVSGCWFHYAQAVMNRLKKIGLSDAYNNEETTQVVFRCLLALPLLPVADRPNFQGRQGVGTGRLTVEDADRATVSCI